MNKGDHTKVTDNLFNTLICLLSLFSVYNLNAQVDPGVNFDLNGYINDKLDAGATTVTVPPGRYRVDPIDRKCLNFVGRNNVTILADSVEMICNNTVSAINIVNCTNFKIRGISVDYDPLPFTQGEIVAISSDKNMLTVDLIDGYGSNVKNGKVEIFDPVTGELTARTYYGTTFSNVIDRSFTISGSTFDDADLGDIVVVGHEGSSYIPHTIRPSGCIGLVLENVTVYAGTSFAFFETDCIGSQYLSCNVERRPPESEIVQRSVRRMRSNNADGFHSKFAIVGPKYIECMARYNGDDGIAINGHYHVILSSNKNIVSVVGREGKETNITGGDTVELIDYSGERLQDAKVIAITSGTALTNAEKEFLQSQTFYGSVANTYKATTSYTIALDRSVDLPIGSLIASANRIGNNFEVRNCIMGPNRSRGLLIQASNGIITGNELVGNVGQAIKVSPEYGWLAAGSSNNLTITDNVISGCHDAAIAVNAEGGNGSTAPAGAHKNITITGNSIAGSTNPGIALTSIHGLVLENNTIDSTNNDLLVPWVKNRFGRNEDPTREIYMKNIIEEPYVMSIEEEKSIKNLKTRVYNTAFSDQFIIAYSDKSDLKFTIYNVAGMNMLTSNINLQNVIDTSNWTPGIYILSLEGEYPVKLLKY